MEPLVKQRAELSKQEIERFSRHLILPSVGREGQERLKASSVLIVGTGGLGSPLALYLAAAGVGRIGLVDFDVVDESNLQRQVIHGQSTVGMSKLDSAERRIKDLNPFVQVDKYNVPLMSDNALDIMAPYDVVVDGTDNFPRATWSMMRASNWASPTCMEASTALRGNSAFWAEHGPCYRCMFPTPPLPGWCPVVLKGAYWAFCPAPSARCKQPKW
jgi:adenylyltransferase/sulfurtransferase